MKNDAREDTGIQLQLQNYRDIFRIPENQEYYSEKDYEVGEGKF